jgi:hypothetical protein
MNDQERQVIDDIFRRLEQVANQPRDPEAERYIADKVRQQPYAPYALAQSVYVQEQALANLNEEVQRLRAELERQPQQQQQGSFLSNIFGGGRAPEPPRGPAQGSPWGRPDQQPMQPMPGQPMQGGYGGYGMPQQSPMQQAPMGGPWGGRPGGGFLQSALGTAAGVAGGMMIANALSHAFTGEHGNLAGQAAGLFGADQNPNDLIGGDAGSSGGITDALYQDASPDNSDQGDFGGDGGDFGDSGDDGDWT